MSTDLIPGILELDNINYEFTLSDKFVNLGSAQNLIVGTLSEQRLESCTIAIWCHLM